MISVCASGNRFSPLADSLLAQGEIDSEILVYSSSNITFHSTQALRIDFAVCGFGFAAARISSVMQGAGIVAWAQAVVLVAQSCEINFGLQDARIE